MKRTIVVISIVLTFTLLCGNSYAQRTTQRSIFAPTISSYLEYRTWQKDTGDITQTVSQFSSPVYINLPLSEGLAFNLMGSAALSSFEDNNLSGLCDVKANAVVLLLDETIMLTAGMNLPSGKNQLDAEEILVSKSLSDRALGFRYNRLGEGLDVNVACGIARTFDTVALGGGVGYVLKGEYEYLEDEALKYKPGDQINITGGFDLLLKMLLLRTDLTYSIYQADKLDDLEVFKEGARITIEESAIIPMERLLILLSGRYVNRGANEFLYEEFEEQSKKIYGDQINVNGAAALQLMGPLSVKLLTEGIFIGENEDGQDDATVFGFGGGMALRFMHKSSLDLTGRYYTGNSNNNEASLKGFSMTASVRIVF